jgi:PAS domain S-box-containing protein
MDPHMRSIDGQAKEHDFLSAVLDTAGALVVVVDRRGCIISFNRACEETTGYAASEVIGKHFWNLFLLPNEVLGVRSTFDELTAGQFPNRHENHWLTKGGSPRLIAWSNTALRDSCGRVKYVIGTGIDITERRHAEQALRDANQELERHAAERAAQDDLRRRELELEHISRVYTAGEMAATLAHELNQPLAAIQNFARGGMRRLQSNGVAQDGLHEALEQIAAEASRAGRIIDAVRALTHRQAAECVPLNINELVGEAVRLTELERRQWSSEVRLELADGLPTVAGDRIQIEQVLVNLLRNGMEAMAATPPNRRLLFVQTEPHCETGVAVAVRDCGSGLDKATRDHVFEPFFTTKPHGMGIGLSMCRSIVQAHGGRLWADSDSGAGAIFRFTLPRFR